MTREKFKKLTATLSIKISEHEGRKISGKALRDIRNAKPDQYSQMLERFGSYKAAWDWIKPICAQFGME